MDFFTSILSDDVDPPLTEYPRKSEPGSFTDHSQDHDNDGSDSDEHSPSNRNPHPNAAVGGGGWSFGGLMKTFATRSESVLHTYRRDLKEFGSGLKNETDLLREVASRAVKELPASIEAGASVAHGSLETAGHAIDGVLKSTAEIISHGKDALLVPSDGESDLSDSQNYSNQSLTPRRYSRFDAQLSTIQSDSSTYCEDPEDLDYYNKWKLGFVLEEKSEEVKSLMEENGTVEGMYQKVVPNAVDIETFWCRYFYWVHKLKQQESVRANLVKRAISADDEEELTWDVDDEDEEEEETAKPSKMDDSLAVENKESGAKALPDIVEGSKIVDERRESNAAEPSNSDAVKGENEPTVDDVNMSTAEEFCSVEASNEKLLSEQCSEVTNVELVSKSDEKPALDGKNDNVESRKDGNVSVASSHPSMLEEDLGWDEIEDLGSSDEK